MTDDAVEDGAGKGFAIWCFFLLSSLFWLAYRGSKGDFDGHFTWVPTSDVCMSLFYIAIIIALFISLTDGLIGFGNITMKNILIVIFIPFFLILGYIALIMGYYLFLIYIGIGLFWGPRQGLVLR